jgi:hypothetical protein
MKTTTVLIAALLASSGAMASEPPSSGTPSWQAPLLTQKALTSPPRSQATTPSTPPAAWHEPYTAFTKIAAIALFPHAYSSSGCADAPASVGRSPGEGKVRTGRSCETSSAP